MRITSQPPADFTVKLQRSRRRKPTEKWQHGLWRDARWSDLPLGYGIDDVADVVARQAVMGGETERAVHHPVALGQPPGRLAVGDEARIILDPVPDYVVPAKVSFVAADAQFTPKTVETTDERAKLMFRVKLKIDAQVLQQFYTRVKTGVRGLGFVRTKGDVAWPAELDVKLPKPPADRASDNKAPETKTPDAK